MGQAANKEAASHFKGLILEGVVPQVREPELGHGAYGRVFTVRYHGKLYAAKEIHKSLIDDQVNTDEKQAIKNSFVQECLRCSGIQHPNIVQFVGVYYPKRADFPIMVMELMSDNLTSFVKQYQSCIDVKTKMSILYGISLGLNYLHTREPPILHRDLSSNNVMLTKELVAKIGDLGVAKVVRANSEMTKSRLTTAPGTQVFMPPEALMEDNVAYGTPIDVFSFGCIVVHVFSEQWPKPGPPKAVDHVTDKLVAYTEVERRRNYLEGMIGNEVSILREVAERCLSENPSLRPTIGEISDLVLLLKTPQLDAQDPIDIPKAPTSKFQAKEPDNHFAEALKAGQHCIVWSPRASLPVELCYPSVAVSGNESTVYVTGQSDSEDAEHNVYSYHVKTDKWQELPAPGHRLGVLCMVDDELTIFGGRDSITNYVHSKVKTYDSIRKEWVGCYPDMLKARSKPGVVAYHDYIIVMGGGSSDIDDHNSIEIMNYRCSQWIEVCASLPVSMYNITPTISADSIVITGYSHNIRCATCYQVSAEELVSLYASDQSSSILTLWKTLSPAPYFNTAIVPYSNPPTVIGGELTGNRTKDIHVYDPSTCKWIKVDSLTSYRDCVGVAYIDSIILVIGGTNGSGCVTTVELGRIVPK